MSNTSEIDRMLGMLTAQPTPKVASAPQVEAPTPAPAGEPSAPATTVAAAAAKIASAEDGLMRTSAAEFGREFAKAASEYFEKEGTFTKTASAPADSAAVDAAFRAGIVKGAEDAISTFQRGYANNLKLAHGMATAAHLSGQQHAAYLRKHAADLTAMQEAVASGQTKQADAEVPLIATLPFGVGPLGALATAPRGRGLEGAARSWAGGVLGTPVGAVGGGLLGAGLGAGLGYLTGGEHDAEMASAGGLLGAGIGTGAGGLYGSIAGSRAALAPIYNPAPTRVSLASDDPYDAELEKIAQEYGGYAPYPAPQQPRSGVTPGAMAAFGAAGMGGALAAPTIMEALGPHATGTSVHSYPVPGDMSAPSGSEMLRGMDGIKPRGDSVDADKVHEHMQHLVNSAREHAQAAGSGISGFLHNMQNSAQGHALPEMPEMPDTGALSERGHALMDAGSDLARSALFQ